MDLHVHYQMRAIVSKVYIIVIVTIFIYIIFYKNSSDDTEYKHNT